MSKRSHKTKQRLRALNRERWLDLPRHLSRYEAFLAVLAGAICLAVAWQELSGNGADARTAGTWKSGAAQAAPGSEVSHMLFGTFFACLGSVVLVVGAAGLFGKRRKSSDPKAR